jgi:VWFA-related protein
MTRKILALNLLIMLTVAGSAQQPSTPKDTPAPNTQQEPERSGEDVVRITTNLVQVDAVVTDKAGNQVTDLRSEELEILEDGKPQKITNFSYVSLDAPAGPATPVPRKPVDKNAPPVPSVTLSPEQVHRTIALVVDDLGLSFESTYHVRQAIKKFLDEQMQPNDLVAIIRTSSGIGALQQFSSDKRQLYAALERVKWNPLGRGGIGVFAPIADARDSRPDTGGRENSTVNPEDVDVERFREDIFSVGTLGAINYIVRGLRELPGRKSVIVMSDGIRIFNGSDPGSGQRVLDALRRLTDLANRASVVIYTMDARGLQPLGLSAEDSTSGMSAGDIEDKLADRRSSFFESQSGLVYLAKQTGGFALINSNDLARGIKRVTEDQKGYYLIGYRPDESTFDATSGGRKFHKLSLRVTRPGKFNVRVRNGFFGVTDEQRPPQPRTRLSQLLAALSSPFGSAGVRLRLTSLFAYDLKTGSLMRSMLHVDAGDLTFTDQPDGWHHAVFDILAVTFGDNGVVVDQISRTHTIKLRGKTYDQILKEGFTYSMIVPIRKPGAYQLRTALRDVASERVGSATQFIEVPNIKKNRLTLSGMLVRGMSQQAYLKEVATPNQVVNADETDGESDPETSATVRRFKPGTVLVYGFTVYNARIDKQTGQPRLQTQVRLFRDGELLFTGKEQPFDLAKQTEFKQVVIAGAMQFGSEMVPGEYVLQVIVTDLAASDKYRIATQWTDFEILKTSDK